MIEMIYSDCLNRDFHKIIKIARIIK